MSTPHLDALSTPGASGTRAAGTVPSLAIPLMPVVQRPDPVMRRGVGSYLWDEDGKRYLDVVQGWASDTLGHSAPEVLAALADQASLLINPSPAYYNRPAIELALLLARLTDGAQVALAQE